MTKQLTVFTESEFNAIHPDYRSDWTTERTDLKNWDQERERYMGKRTLMRQGALWIEGISFQVVPDDTPQCLTMVVDLDERGSFKAHVDDQAGKEIYAFSNDGEDGWPDPDGLWLVQCGYMSHSRDSDGLLGYLASIKLASGKETMTVEG